MIEEVSYMRALRDEIKDSKLNQKNKKVLIEKKWFILLTNFI